MQCYCATDEVDQRASLLQQWYDTQVARAWKSTATVIANLLVDVVRFSKLTATKESLRHKYLGQEDVDGTVPRAVLEFPEPKQTGCKRPGVQKSQHVLEAPAIRSSRARKRATSDTAASIPRQQKRTARSPSTVMDDKFLMDDTSSKLSTSSSRDSPPSDDDTMQFLAEHHLPEEC